MIKIDLSERDYRVVLKSNHGCYDRRTVTDPKRANGKRCHSEICFHGKAEIKQEYFDELSVGGLASMYSPYIAAFCSGPLWVVFRNGSVIRPWDRCCCAGESQRPIRHSLARTLPRHKRPTLPQSANRSRRRLRRKSRRIADARCRSREQNHWPCRSTNSGCNGN